MEDNSGVDSIIDNISKIIMSQNDSPNYAENQTDEFSEILHSNQSPEKKISPKQAKLEILKGIKEAREEISKKLNQELRNLQTSHANTTQAHFTRNTNISCKTADFSERLYEFSKKKQEKIDAIIAEKMKAEQESLKIKPLISNGSKRLMDKGKYVPIYSKERLQQIDQKKKQKVMKIKQEMEEKKKKAEEEELINSTPTYKGSEITNVELCFDPNAVKPMVYQFGDNAPKKSTVVESSEDEQLKNCSFHPETDKMSEKLFSKKNVNNKPVVERLMDYGKYQKKSQEKRIEESKPTFKPQKQKYNKNTKKFLTVEEENKEKEENDEDKKLNKIENGNKKNTIDDLKELMIKKAQKQEKESQIKDTSSVMTSVISKYIV